MDLNNEISFVYKNTANLPQYCGKIDFVCSFYNSQTSFAISYDVRRIRSSATNSKLLIVYFK